MIGLSAVTNIGLRVNALVKLSSCTVNPAIALSASKRLVLASKLRLSQRLRATNGNMTFNSKLPDCQATVIAASLPLTCAATMALASELTGFTLPGIMDEPG